MPTKNHINLRSEEVKEILGRPPRWMIRWGITVIFSVILLILLGSWFFRYPEVVTSRITVTTQFPPSPIVARTSGKIDQLFVADQQEVKVGEALAVIEDAANYKDVLELEGKLQQFHTQLRKGQELRTVFSSSYTLGGLQSVYAAFQKQVEELQNYQQLDYHEKRIASLHEEEQKYRQYRQKLSKQRDISKNEYTLAQKQYQRDSLLHVKEVIPQAALEEAQGKLLQKQYAYEQNEIALSNARIQLSKIEQGILDLELQQEQQRNLLESQLLESWDRLKGEIDSWKQMYYLESPVAGKVSFTSYWSANQYVEAGKRVMTIVPEEEGRMLGKISLGFTGAGKVKVGQEVNIRFDNYPHMEYGMVKAVVRRISMVPEDQVYMVEVDFPEGLTTFYGEQLDFHQQMQGSADIITQDLRLLQKILRPLRFMVHKNLK